MTAQRSTGLRTYKLSALPFWPAFSQLKIFSVAEGEEVHREAKRQMSNIATEDSADDASRASPKIMKFTSIENEW